jgi:hypothetical protein
MTASSAIPPVDTYAPGLVTRAPEGTLSKLGLIIFLIGAAALATSFVGLWLANGADHEVEGHPYRTNFYMVYLVAYMFTLSLALGALFFVIVQHVARAGWSIVVRRVAENMAVTLPAMLLLFIPILIGAHDIYHHWMGAIIDPAMEGKGYDAIIAGKSGYLNETFFYIRAAIYFTVWITLAIWFRRKSIEQDENGNPELSLKMARVGAPGLVAFGVTLTFAAFDWIMSIDPHWFSTMFGVTYFAGSVMAFLALLALTCMFLASKNLLKDAVNAEHYHDIGKLMFAFMIFWSYVNFSQYFLIQYADIPEETLWFQKRAVDGSNWGTVGIILVAGHFLVPFIFLMSRHMKRNRTPLEIGAAFLLVMHWIDMQFLIMPDGKPPAPDHLGSNFAPGWVDAATLIGVFGIFLGLTLRNIAGSNLLPTRDPKLKESLKFVNI